MHFEIGNVLTRATGTEEEISVLDGYLTFEDERAKFRTTYGQVQAGAPSTFRMYNPWNGTFLSGLAKQAAKHLRANGVTVTTHVVDLAPCGVDAVTFRPEAGVTLRDYQVQALDVARFVRRGIFAWGTGAGKTTLAVALSQQFPIRWGFFVHKLSLADQVARRYSELTGLRPGFIGDGRRDEGDGQFIAVSWSSLKKLSPADVEMLKSFQGIFVDEVHTAASEVYTRVLKHTTNAYFRYGLSATPTDRGDLRAVYAVATLGPIIHQVRPGQLIERGLLAAPTIVMHKVRSAISQAPTWLGVYGETAIRNTRRNRMVVDLAAEHAKDGPTVVFVRSIAHGKALKVAIERAGQSTRFVNGSDSLTFRRHACRDLVSRSLGVLVVTDGVFAEGVDVPEIEHVIIASGGKSVINTIQRIGRGMRATSTKNTFTVDDFFDVGCGKCAGAAHRSCQWLLRHTRDRKKTYERDYKVTVLAEMPEPAEPPDQDPTNGADIENFLALRGGDT
jgi:superfamily II DNA or RNA helicase